jgi:hypothetical protein
LRQPLRAKAQAEPAWLAATSAGRSAVPNWTIDPIVQVTRPG